MNSLQTRRDHELKLEVADDTYTRVTLLATGSPATGSAGDRLISAYRRFILSSAANAVNWDLRELLRCIYNVQSSRSTISFSSFSLNC